MPALTTALCAAGLALLAAAIKVLRLPGRMRYNLIVNPLRRAAALVDQPDGWQARHFVVAPFGGLLSTWLWGNYGPGWAQLDNFGVLFYGATAVMLEGGYQMFYAISKRRRDINAAEDRGRDEGKEIGRDEGRTEGMAIGRTEGVEIGRTEGMEIGRTEGMEIGRNEVLYTLAARLQDEPDADPVAIIAELLAQSQNGRTQ